MSVLLSDAIALSTWSGHPAQAGHLLNLPEHPDERRTQTNHDNQKHQRQCGRCEHVQHPPCGANGVSANDINNGLGVITPGRIIHPGRTGSVADLHGPNAPAIRREHTSPNDVAAAIAVVVGIVVAIAGVIRIAVIIIIVVVAAVEPVAQADTDRCRGNRKSPMPESGVEATAEVVHGKGAAAKSGSRQSGRTETTAADRGGPEAATAHSHPAAEATAAHSHPATA